jgi:hypothetical protein
MGRKGQWVRLTCRNCSHVWIVPVGLSKTFGNLTRLAYGSGHADAVFTRDLATQLAITCKACGSVGFVSVEEVSDQQAQRKRQAHVADVPLMPPI